MSSFGFDFRATSGFVTDPSGATYSIGDTYPQTRNGITFGWTTGPGGARDRSNTVNVRVAGMNFSSASSPGTFRVDLPASGSYNIGCAMGDATNDQTIQYIEIFDNTTSLWSMQSGGNANANHYYDLTGVLRTSDSDWFTNQAFESLTFSSTVLKAVIGKSGVGSNHCLAHLDVNQAGGGATRLVKMAGRFGGYAGSSGGFAG